MQRAALLTVLTSAAFAEQGVVTKIDRPPSCATWACAGCRIAMQIETITAGTWAVSGAPDKSRTALDRRFYPRLGP